MKLGNGKSAEVLSTEQTKKMSIDTDSMHILQMLLSQNLYQDPVSSIIRELSSNSVDAVIEAGKDPIQNPVVVRTYEEGGNFFFSVRDTGLGLDEQTFDDIISKWLRSTKRESDETIGAFGIN